jgi:hypothetical protein
MGYARKSLISLNDTPYYHPKPLRAFRVFPPSMAVALCRTLRTSRMAVGCG